MESWMRVGAKCVCVKADEYSTEIQRRFFLPVEGSIYTIRGVHRRVSSDGIYFTLREIENVKSSTWINEPPGELDFNANRFRPLVRQTDITSLRALLDQPADPALVREALNDATLDVVQRIGMKF